MVYTASYLYAKYTKLELLLRIHNEYFYKILLYFKCVIVIVFIHNIILLYAGKL